MGNYQSLMYKKKLNKVQQQMTLNKVNKISPFTGIDEKDLEYLFESTSNFNDYKLNVDLKKNLLADNKGFEIFFNIDPFRKKCLLEGLDDIALTLEHSEKIDNYEKAL